MRRLDDVHRQQKRVERQGVAEFAEGRIVSHGKPRARGRYGTAPSSFCFPRPKQQLLAYEFFEILVQHFFSHLLI